jgi:RHS repeat-associated protein
MPTFWDANNQPLANNQSTIGNNYLFQGREYDKETNLYYYRARYYDPIMGRFLQTDPMGYQDSMNLYQAFNMNGVNFLDPVGEKIYLSGPSPARSLQAIKKMFIDIGVDATELKNSIKVDRDNTGIFITKDSYIPMSKQNTLDVLKDQELNTQFLRYSTNLKQGSDNLRSLNKVLEFFFNEMIQSPINIDFAVDSTAFYGKGKPNSDGWISNDYYGRGVCIEPGNTLKNEEDNPNQDPNTIQIIVDPEPPLRSTMVNAEGHKARLFFQNQNTQIPLALEMTIAHEFGHAYAYMKGNKPDPKGKDHTKLNAEIAVLFENIFRLRVSNMRKDETLRRFH